VDHYLDSWAIPHHCADSLASLLETLRRLDAAGSKPDVLLLVEPLPDATLEQAVQTLAVEGIPLVVCLQEQDNQRKTSLAQQGIAVLHKPMKQSALLDALTIQWTPGTIRLHTPEVSKSPAAATAPASTTTICCWPKTTRSTSAWPPACCTSWAMAWMWSVTEMKRWPQ
jgi:hypothetical protein